MSNNSSSNEDARQDLFGSPLVLEGEDAAAYDELMGRVYAAIKPVDVVDEMLIAEVVSSEWEFLRWGRVKSNLLRACAVKGLEAFLKKNLDCNLYQEYFVGKLTQVLKAILPKHQAEGSARTLAEDYAQDKSEAINQVNKLLDKMFIDKVLADARARKAEELVEGYVRREPGTVKIIDKVLENWKLGIDELMSQALAEDLDCIERIDRLTTIAEGRRNGSLREIDRRRSVLSEKLRRTIQEVEDGETKLIETAERIESGAT
jgi:predicted transcriptional regulator